MVTSMTTTSGASCDTRRTASSPSPASLDDVEAGVVERATQRLAQQLVIVGDEHGGHLVTSSSTSTDRPEPGFARRV